MLSVEWFISRFHALALASVTADCAKLKLRFV